MCETKKCSKCNEEKPATLEFFKRKIRGKYGLHYHCRPCMNSERRRLHEEKTDEINRECNICNKPFSTYNKLFTHCEEHRSRANCKNEAARLMTDNYIKQSLRIKNLSQELIIIKRREICLRRKKQQLE